MFKFFQLSNQLDNFFDKRSEVTSILSNRESIVEQAGNGAHLVDFTWPFILIVLAVVAYLAFRHHQKVTAVELRARQDLVRAEEANLSAKRTVPEMAAEVDRLKSELVQARHLISVLRAGAYVPSGDVPEDTPAVDEVFGAGSVPGTAAETPAPTAVDDEAKASDQPAEDTGEVDAPDSPGENDDIDPEILSQIFKDEDGMKQ